MTAGKRWRDVPVRGLTLGGLVAMLIAAAAFTRAGWIQTPSATVPIPTTATAQVMVERIHQVESENDVQDVRIDQNTKDIGELKDTVGDTRDLARDTNVLLRDYMRRRGLKPVTSPPAAADE